MSELPLSDSPGGENRGVTHVDVDAERAGQRIDNFLISQLKGLPKSRVYRWLRRGEVRVNKGRVKADYKLCAGDQVRIPPVRLAAQSAPVVAGPRLRDLVEHAILYEDERMLALNKPAGIAVHGGSGVDLGVIEVLRQHFSAPQWELVHRLDRDTSGCLLVAKNRAALRQLQHQFRQQQTRKNYLTLVHGYWPTRCHTVNLPLKKNQLAGGERIVKVDPEGKAATTQFSIHQRYRDCTLLEVGLVTGRTHQIRVHTQAQGHPILGDDKYGDAASQALAKRLGLKRLFLHAQQLHFYLPISGGERGERMTLDAPLPDDLNTVLQSLTVDEDDKAERED